MQRDDVTINGLTDYSVMCREHFDINESELVYLESAEGNHSCIRFKDKFLPGSVIVFRY